MSRASIRTGDIFSMKLGGEVVVIEYKSSNNILVEHMDKYSHRVTVEAVQLRRGSVKNPYKPSVCGAGFIGVGPHIVSLDLKATNTYGAWSRMLERVFSKGLHVKRPTYSDTTCTTEWLNFQVFAEWWHKQENADVKGFALDKDLLVMGNREYGPRYCSFVPQQINTLLIDCGASSGELPIGVSFTGSGWRARSNTEGVRAQSKTYRTIQEAASYYKESKEAHVKSMADKYKSVLHPKVYANLMNWEVPEYKPK